MRRIERRREYAKGQIVYVIGYNFTGGKWEFCVDIAKIMCLTHCNNSIVVYIPSLGDKVKKYSLFDENYLFFTKKEKAEEFIEKLPKVGDTIYQICGTRVYKKTIVSISTYNKDECDNLYFDLNKGKSVPISPYNRDDCHNLYFDLNKGKSVPIEELGYSIFVNEADARKVNKKTEIHEYANGTKVTILSKNDLDIRYFSDGMRLTRMAKLTREAIRMGYSIALIEKGNFTRDSFVEQASDILSSIYTRKLEIWGVTDFSYHDSDSIFVAFKGE